MHGISLAGILSSRANTPDSGGGIAGQKTIEFANPSPTHKVWRHGENKTGTIAYPLGYTCAWQILDYELGIIVVSGTGPLVNYTFAFAPTGVKSYDLRVVVSGPATYERRFADEFTILQPLFTEAQANLVVDFSTNGVTYRDNNLVDRPDYKVFCKGKYNAAKAASGFNAYLGIEEFVSSNPNKPVIWQADPVNGCEINSNAVYCLRVNQNCKNFIMDGCTNESIQYGFKLTMPGTGNRAQIFYVESSTNAGSNPSIAGANITLCGFFLDGMNISSAGIKVDTANSGPPVSPSIFGNVSYEYYIANGVSAFFKPRIFNCYITRTKDEGVYFGYVDDIPHSGYSHAPIVGAKMYRMQAVDTGGDSFQMGAAMFQSEMHHCTVINGGTRDDPNHRNGIQLSSGNRDFAVYSCRIYGSKNMMSIFSGRGGGDIEIFSNIFENYNTAGHTNIFSVIYPNDYNALMKWSIFNNTFRVAQNVVLEVWNLTLTPPVTNTRVQLNWVDNIVVSPDTRDYYTMNSPNQTDWLVGANYQTTNVNAPLFVDQANGDYHLASLSSPAFRPTHSFSKAHRMAGYDYEGVKYPTGVAGAFSGYELMMNP